MDKDYTVFIDKFYEIKNMGYIPSINNGSSGVGRTFEKALGIKGNCDVFPDFNGIEIKTKASKFHSELSLFNCTPVGNVQYEIERLKEKYGYPDRTYKKYKVLSASVNSLEERKVGIFYKFKLKVDKYHNKIVLLVFNLKNEIVDDTTFWPIDLIESRFMGKCSLLAFINAEKSYNGGIRAYWYNSLRVMQPKPFDTFIKLLEKGFITIEFKIGISKASDTLGKIYDHGTAFKIDEKNLEMLFDVLYDSSKQNKSVLNDQGT
ncbi:MAG: MvaI/BcnI family restriction endonuclease [Bacilli bacterium]|nr:MvaI/BcnI family restriction endonuclease [Bacilli bacterium]